MERRNRGFLLVLGILFLVGFVLADRKVVRNKRNSHGGNCQPYPPDLREYQYYLRICIGVDVDSDAINPRGRLDPCDLIRGGFYESREVVSHECSCGSVIPVYNQFSMACVDMILSSVNPQNRRLNRAILIQEFSPVFIPGYIMGEFTIEDINLCQPERNLCSADSTCSQDWGTYECKCRPDYEDKSQGRPGTDCRRPEFRPDDVSPIEDLELWMYILIALAIGVVIMLLICCACHRSPYGQRVKKKIRHIKIFHPSAPAPAPACSQTVLPQVSGHGGRVNLFVEEKDDHLKILPKPNPYGQISDDGPSAFIANSGYDGKVYVANPSEDPAPAPNALPWINGQAIEGLPQQTTTYLTLGDPQPQQVTQVLTTDQPQMFATTEPQMITAGEPQMAQYVTAAEPQFITGQPQFIGAEPQFVSTEPQFVSTEPQYVSTEPQYIAAEPQQQFITTADSSALFMPQDQSVYQGGTGSGSVMFLQ